MQFEFLGGPFVPPGGFWKKTQKTSHNGMGRLAALKVRQTVSGKFPEIRK